MAELTKTRGLALRERQFGDEGKFVDLLTENGVVSVKSSARLNSERRMATGLFTYSDFVLARGKSCHYINSCEILRTFYGVRSDIFKTAFAFYLSELICFSVLEETNSREILRLALNTLHFLEKDFPLPLLKAIFELRLLTDLGFQPNLSPRLEDFFKSYNDEHIENDEKAENSKAFEKSFQKSMEFICTVETNKLWSFKVSDKLSETLSKAAEDITINSLERSFKSLEFYNSLFKIF